MAGQCDQEGQAPFCHGPVAGIRSTIPSVLCKSGGGVCAVVLLGTRFCAVNFRIHQLNDHCNSRSLLNVFCGVETQFLLQFRCYNGTITIICDYRVDKFLA